MNKDREPKQETIIDILNESLKDKALEDTDIPTVQSIAESIGIDETTLYRWLRNDAQFATDLHQINRLDEINKEILEKFPDLAWTEEEKRIISEATGKDPQEMEGLTAQFHIFNAIVGAKERHHMIN